MNPRDEDLMAESAERIYRHMRMGSDAELTPDVPDGIHQVLRLLAVADPSSSSHRACPEEDGESGTRAASEALSIDRFKLIRFYQTDEWEFYDLQEDPEELTNQYSNPKYLNTIDQLKAELEELRLHYRDDTDTRVMPREWIEKHRAGDA